VPFGVDFGTAVKSFERNLRLPFTPPLITISGPSSDSNLIMTIAFHKSLTTKEAEKFPK
jgi:hypothetical protein